MLSNGRVPLGRSFPALSASIIYIQIFCGFWGIKLQTFLNKTSCSCVLLRPRAILHAKPHLSSFRLQKGAAASNRVSHVQHVQCFLLQQDSGLHSFLCIPTASKNAEFCTKKGPAIKCIAGPQPLNLKYIKSPFA